ncbi:hypothetical protein [Vibrio sp. MEBiC08052]|uniref:hypothetical protein n=1 Tax=Vibrio sp. MEBiC08052 TaxID=1761910 RepID=UPI00074074AF|nr:hypothetical protein [Vibrio sp. MEBiC08052]KUJ00548.1 hypothetical protein VRK_00500 [Vibrio sp. MEBiC08052]
MNVTLIESKVQSYQAVTPTIVRIELVDSQTVILRLSESWVLNQGDSVAIAGFQDPQSNMFIGYGYINLSQHVQSITRSNGLSFLVFGALLSVITLGIIAFIFSGSGVTPFYNLLLIFPLLIVFLFSGFFIWIGIKAKQKERAVKKVLDQVKIDVLVDAATLG